MIGESENAPYTAVWHQNIDEISEHDWNRIQGTDSSLRSYGFSRAVERSSLDAVDIQYLAVYSAGRPIALASCFVFKVDIVLLAPDVIRKITAFIRKGWPSFLNLRLLFVGSPLATCDSHLAIDPALAIEEWPNVGKLIFAELCGAARRNCCFFMLAKEIPESTVGTFKKIFNERFRLFPSLPTSRIPLLPGDLAYPSTLRKSYKKRVKSALIESDRAGHQWEILTDFAHLSNDFYALYLQVYERSMSKFEKLTPNFLARIAEEMPGHSELLTCLDADGRLIAVSLLVFDDERLTPVYIGMDYSRTQNTAVYYNLIFRAVQEAERLGKRCIVLGQNSYEAKANSGAVFESLFLGLHSEYQLGHWLIKYVFRLIFKDTTLPRTVHNEAATSHPAFVDACRA